MFAEEGRLPKQQNFAPPHLQSHMSQLFVKNEDLSHALEGLGRKTKTGGLAVLGERGEGGPFAVERIMMFAVCQIGWTGPYA